MQTAYAPSTPAALTRLPDLLFNMMRDRRRRPVMRPRHAYQAVVRHDLFSQELSLG